MKNKLEIKNLHVSVGKKEILKGIYLTLQEGKITALMGPNGSGKSTLVNTIMGHPKYQITKGKILFNNKNITKLTPTEKAKLGIFLSFQYPTQIDGITYKIFLKQALNSIKKTKIKTLEFKELLNKKLSLLNLDKEITKRNLNTGFSGGEKKKMEMLQMLILNPNLILLDETDSGLDIDALKIVSQAVNQIMSEKNSIFIITHYKRILEFIKPEKVYIMINGKIALEGSSDLIDHLEEKGYGWIENK